MWREMELHTPQHLVIYDFHFAFRYTSDWNVIASLLTAGIAQDTPKQSSQCEISGSPSGVPDESNLLEYYAGLTSEKLPPFRRKGSRT